MKSGICALLFAAVFSAPAQATIVSGSIDFTATNFTDISSFPPIPAPVDPVTGTVTFSFDNVASFADVTTGLTVTGLNILGELGPGMTYLKGADTLVVGDLVCSVVTVCGGRYDWFAVILRVSTSPVFDYLVYSTPAGTPAESHTWISSEPHGIPEPSTMALLGIALAGLGFSRRKQ